MPFVPVQNTAQFQVIFSQDDQRVQNNYYVRFSQPPTLIDMENKAQDLIDWWSNECASMTVAGVELLQVDYRDLTTLTGPAGSMSSGGGIVGTSLGAALPNNVTFAVTLLTAARGRSFRGRIYYVGVPAGSTSGSHLQDIPRNNYVIAFDHLRTAMFGTGADRLVVVSRQANGAWRSQGVTTEVTGVAIDGILDSQRRRLPGRGN